MCCPHLWKIKVFVPVSGVDVVKENSAYAAWFVAVGQVEITVAPVLNFVIFAVVTIAAVFEGGMKVFVFCVRKKQVLGRIRHPASVWWCKSCANSCELGNVGIAYKATREYPMPRRRRYFLVAPGFGLNSFLKWLKKRWKYWPWTFQNTTFHDGNLAPAAWGFRPFVWCQIFLEKRPVLKLRSVAPVRFQFFQIAAQSRSRKSKKSRPHLCLSLAVKRGWFLRFIWIL